VPNKPQKFKKPRNGSLSINPKPRTSNSKGRGGIAYKYVKHQKILLKTHPQLNEKWIQDCIAEKPSVLGLGELILKDKERNQPGAGRLDLLFQDPDANLRYEVEIQLGKTDESHIIRTIEYWDLERKRFPQYDHVAVLIAEDMTSRFLNIISLFNGIIPLVAIQLNAIQVGSQITIVFTTVLDQRLGFAIEEEEEQEVTDRTYWERRGSTITVGMADEVLHILKEMDHELELKYNKFYIGVAKYNKPFNFVIFQPKVRSLRVEPKLQRSDEIEEKLESADLDILEYDSRNQRYRIRLSKGDVSNHENLLREILERAYREFNGYGSLM
jgi:hypothetical protein